MGKFAYRPMGIVVLIFLVVSRCLDTRLGGEANALGDLARLDCDAV